MRTWWNLKTGERMSGSDRDYYAYKIQKLIERQDSLKEDYFEDVLLHLLEEYLKAFNYEMGYEVD